MGNIFKAIILIISLIGQFVMFGLGQVYILCGGEGSGCVPKYLTKQGIIFSAVFITFLLSDLLIVSSLFPNSIKLPNWLSVLVWIVVSIGILTSLFLFF